MTSKIKHKVLLSPLMLELKFGLAKGLNYSNTDTDTALLS
jgi:hypothetical protein